MNNMQEQKVGMDLLKSIRHASVNDKADAIEDTLVRLGAKKMSDIINPDSTRAYDIFRASSNVRFSTPREAHFKARLSGMPENVRLSTYGDTLLNGTSLITGVMEKVTPYLQMETMRQLFPEAEYASQRLLLDVFDEIVGMTHNTPLDAPVPIIKKRGLNTQEFQPATSHEALEISQQEILFLRDPGNQNISIRGLAMYMAKWSEQLSHRGLVKQLNDIYTAIFTHQYKWQNQTISYGIPSGNTINTNVLSGSWGTIGNATTPSYYNAAANPILDLTQIINQILQTYRGLKLKLIMNNRTNQLIVQNPNVIARTPYIYANGVMVNPRETGGVTVDTLLKYYLGGDLGVDVIIDNSTYIADANDPNGNYDPAHALASYPVLPDYKIWIYIDTDGFGKPLGEYAYTLATQNGGTSNPKAGKYFYMVDTSISQTFDGISQPRIFLGHGWNGSPRIMRPQDIWTINVAA